MRRFFMAAAAVAGVAALGAPGGVAGQQSGLLEVGAEAPDFSLAGAVRHGVLAEPVTLSEYEGKTVVLSFFFRARTKG